MDRERDSGFTRAQRAYDAQEPPDNTDDLDAYEDRYVTAENRKSLVDCLTNSVHEHWAHSEIHDADIARALHTLLNKGLEHLDAEDIGHLFTCYNIAPSFLSFVESLEADDGPDPDIERDDETPSDWND